MELLSEKQIAVIKSEIDEKLRIRCVPTETTLELKLNRSNQSVLTLTSTKFNTVPVIHSEIEIINFGGSVQRDTEDLSKVLFYIPVSAAYQGNCEGLFKIGGYVKEGYITFNGQEAGFYVG